MEHLDWSSSGHVPMPGPITVAHRNGVLVLVHGVECALPLAREGGIKAESLHQNPLVVAGSGNQFFKEVVVDLGSQNCKCSLRAYKGLLCKPVGARSL